MENRGSRSIFYSSNMVNLCIDSWTREGQRGRLYHPYAADAIPFLSLYEALDRMERLYDMLQYPEASAVFRTFTPHHGPEKCENSKADRIVELSGRRERHRRNQESESLKHLIGHRGSAATFMIHVRYRQHSSWQGEITWVDEQQKESFRSVWELIRLMDGALHSEL